MNGLPPRSAKRDIALALIGAAVSAAALNATTLAASRASESKDRTIESVPSRAPGGSRAEPCSAAAASSSLANAVGVGAGPLEQVRSELQELRLQRSKLQEKLGAVEKALQKQEEPAPYEYDLTREQWRELASASRIKYRMPCPMPADSNWTVGAPILKELGLSADDREPLMEALRRSNSRVWATVKPMCAELVGQDDVVELLGFERCKDLIEQASQAKDRLAMHDAQRLVAEVRAGMSEAPTPDEAPSDLYRMYMVLTGEADLFEADLAKSFGPEVAQRIWHSFPCAATVK